MLRQISLNQREHELAGLTRKAATGRDVLFHGTRHASSIRTTGVLFHSIPGDPMVSFTRCPETAAYFALMERDDDEGCGAILIFDRQSLRCRYRIEPWHDDIWDDETGRRDEMEERVWENISDVGHHLIGVVTEPMTRRSKEPKPHRRAFQERIRARLAAIESDDARKAIGER